MERALGALRICSQKIADRPLARARLIATEACRRAANGADFLARVRDETRAGPRDHRPRAPRRGWRRRAASRCSTRRPRAPSSSISAAARRRSSGSTAEGPPPRRLVRAWVSLPVGVVTLAERHGGIDVDAPSSRRWSRTCAPSSAPFAPAMRSQAVGASALPLLGTSGTVTTLAGVHLDLPRYDRRRVDGLWMDEADIEVMMTRSAAWITRRAAQSLHRPRARRSRARRLRHLRGDPPRMALQPAARRRPRPARGNSRAADARRRASARPRPSRPARAPQ